MGTPTQRSIVYHEMNFSLYRIDLCYRIKDAVSIYKKKKKIYAEALARLNVNFMERLPMTLVFMFLVYWFSEENEF